MIKNLYKKLQVLYVISTYQKSISTLLGEDKKVIQEVFQSNYINLLNEQIFYAKRIFNWHLIRNILPGIALYRALEQEGKTVSDTVCEMEQLYRVLYRNTANIYRLIAHIPGFFTLLRFLSSKSMSVTYPKDGWKRIWIENSRDQIAFDVYTCFYKDILEEYGCEHILKCFCQIDDDMYQAMSLNVEWGRTMTLGRCGEKCDFRFEKKSKKEKMLC